MIRPENNRIDKYLLREYLKEIAKVVNFYQGIDDYSEYIKNFENIFCKYINAKHAKAVNSGTDALQISLISLGIKRGDEVIVPDLTYISTGLAVIYSGAKPVFVDVKKEDLTVDENKLENAITEKTKAIIPVHMFGHPCNMKVIAEIAEKHDLKIIEDCCQAFSCKINERMVGTFGDASAFSFSYYKPLSSLSGNGGMIVFRDSGLARSIEDLIKLWKCNDLLKVSGRKFHKISLVDVATILVKLKNFRLIEKSRKEAQKLYRENLEEVEEIEIPSERKGRASIMENFVILVEKRDKLIEYLNRKGIKIEHPYRPLHTIKMFGYKAKPQEFSVTERYYQKGLHLPLYSLMKPEEVEKVTEAIIHFYS